MVHYYTLNHGVKTNSSLEPQSLPQPINIRLKPKKEPSAKKKKTTALKSKSIGKALGLKDLSIQDSELKGVFSEKKSIFEHEKEDNSYLKLRDEINTYLEYPSHLRKEKITGRVQVYFSLNENRKIHWKTLRICSDQSYLNAYIYKVIQKSLKTYTFQGDSQDYSLKFIFSLSTDHHKHLIEKDAFYTFVRKAYGVKSGADKLTQAMRDIQSLGTNLILRELNEARRLSPLEKQRMQELKDSSYYGIGCQKASF